MKWKFWVRVPEVVEPVYSKEDRLGDFEWGKSTGNHSCSLASGEYAMTCWALLPKYRADVFGLGYDVGQAELKLWRKDRMEGE